MMKKMVMLCGVIVLASCANDQINYEQQVEVAVQLCQSETAKAYSQTADGLRIMCHSGSSYIIRDETSVADLIELNESYCSSMGIREFTSSKEGEKTLVCQDGGSYVL